MAIQPLMLMACLPQGELIVAGVFVRVYNEQPAFPVADPAAFCKGLVTYLHAQTQQQQQQRAPAAEGVRPSCAAHCKER